MNLNLSKAKANERWQLQEEYPQIVAVPVPKGSGASKAWECSIQPFADDHNLREIICDLHLDRVVFSESGTLLHDPDCKVNHPQLGIEDFLKRMQVKFRILILEFTDGRHPRVYCLNPEISRTTFPCHPHLSDGWGIWLHRFIPALCIYLASDNVYDSRQYYLLQLLDFTATWLAKHLVWTKTLKILDLNRQCVISNSPLLTTGIDLNGPYWPAGQNPTSCAFFQSRQKQTGFGAVGTWIGPAAPHDIPAMLSRISPQSECPCGNRKRYADCHRPIHIIVARQIGFNFT
jgi:hypothetical protein